MQMRFEMLSPSCKHSHSSGQLDMWSERCIVGSVARILSGRMATSRPLAVFFSTVASSFYIAQTHALGLNCKKLRRSGKTRWATSYLAHFAVKLRCRGVLCSCLHRPLKRQQHLGLFTIALKNFSLQHLTTETVNSNKTLFQTFLTILGVTLTPSPCQM